MGQVTVRAVLLWWVVRGCMFSVLFILYFLVFFCYIVNQWTGLLEWTTGMDFDLFFLFFLPQEPTIYIDPSPRWLSL